ncbi:MAG: hypothetical protein AAGG48_17365 [Planctomycetota bacterium]
MRVGCDGNWFNDYVVDWLPLNSQNCLMNGTRTQFTFTENVLMARWGVSRFVHMSVVYAAKQMLRRPGKDDYQGNHCHQALKSSIGHYS